MLPYKNHISTAFIAVTILGFLFFSSEAAYPPVHICGSETSTYNPNSTYQSNLNTTLSFLYSNTSTLFHYATAGGVPPNVAYGLFLCRGDVNIDVCRDCVLTAGNELVTRCPKEKEAYIWGDYCLLRYNNKSFFSTATDWPYQALVYGEIINDPTRFRRVLGDTMDGLASRASADQLANNQSVKRFATGETNFTSLQKIYALVQCTPDLSGSDCEMCIRQAMWRLPECCDGEKGARVLLPSCVIRYESAPFYNSTAPPPSPPPKGRKDNRIVILIIIISIVVLMILLVYITLVVRKRKLRKPKKKFETVDVIADAISLQYDFDTISVATNNFSNASKLGQGGFGAVYKGRLPNGQEIAVKRLSSFSGQGEQEFKNEVSLLAKLQHRNLVRLLGFCLEGTEKLLIYEFVPNASLDHFIFDPAKRANLDWDVRYKIIGGVARGLLYLHEDSRLRIIHRDLKAGNVLLDALMNPKISDFGLAKLFTVDETQGNTARIVGTRGYMAPEYHHHGQFSVKSDVFSFGVIVLEIVSGQKVNSFQNGEDIVNLLSYAWRNWREGTASNLIDPAMKVHSDSLLYIMRCINIALLCVQENLVNRPPMTQVVLMLSSTSLPLPEPLEHNQSNTSVVFSVDEAMITELNPR